MNRQDTLQLHTGTSIPCIGLGTWELDTNTAETIAHAINMGYRMVDTSSDYGTQPGVAGALKQTNTARSELFLQTKVEETDDAYEATKAYVEEMGVESANMILIHRPPKNGAGVDLWKGLIRARNEGYCTDIGVSNYSVKLIEELIAETEEVPTVNQIEWSPFGHSMQMLEYCQNNQIVLQAYSPLTRATRLDDETLNAIAETYDKSPAQILIRWNLQLGTLPIPKANKIMHVDENLDVFDFEISPGDMQKLNELNEQYSALGHLPYL